MPDRRRLAAAEVGDLVRLGDIDALVLCALRGKKVRRLALMVEARDALLVRKILRAVRGVEATVYTTNGSKSGSFRLDVAEFSAITLAPLPMDLAEALLARARSAIGLPREDRALLAAYVSAYFRAPSRLAGGAEKDPAADTHRSELDRDLLAAGWRPPQDMLERLALADPWIRKYLLPPKGKGPGVEPGLTAFFVRERALAEGFLPRIRETVAENGFEILTEVELVGDAAEELRKSTRGGNWGSGPFSVSGGPPRHILFAFDAFPVRPGRSILRVHPFLDNARTLEVKTATRTVISATTPKRQRFNPLHSSDQSSEAYRISQTILSAAKFEALKAGVAARRLALREVTGQAEPEEGRNVTAICLRRDGVVRRVFRPHLAGHVSAVVQAQRLLPPNWPEVCECLEASTGVVDLADPGPEFAPAKTLGAPLPFALALRLRALLVVAAKAGIVLDHWDPVESVLVNRERTELRLLGFDRPRCLGVPQRLSVTLEHPRTRAELAQLTGISISVFLGGSAPLMRLSREIFQPTTALFLRSGAGFSRVVSALQTRLQ